VDWLLKTGDCLLTTPLSSLAILVIRWPILLLLLARRGSLHGGKEDMHITRRACAAIAAATLIGVAAGATPAYAGTDIGWTRVYLPPGPPYAPIAGAGKFESDGDLVTVCDADADGFGVSATLVDSESNSLAPIVHVGGNGKCVTRTRNLREGTAVKLLVCLTKGSHGEPCKTSGLGAA
jgi:hypothetical protein